MYTNKGLSRIYLDIPVIVFYKRIKNQMRRIHTVIKIRDEKKSLVLSIASRIRYDRVDGY